MIQLLNKFAWFISIFMGITITYILAGGPSQYEEEMVAIIIFGSLIGAICKKVLFSRSYISDRVEHFARVALKGVNQPTEIQSLREDHNPSANDSNIEPEHSSVSEQFASEKITQNAHTNDSNIQEHASTQDTYSQESIEENSSIVSSSQNFITKFFSENILAKIGGILVFLGVIFLLSLLWNAIPGVLKLLIGFIIGMACYFSGVKMDSKGIHNEARILMGTGILINYAVILSGRYIIGETSIDSTPLLSTGISFLFIILNTLFAVLTSLYYKSGPLLVFSFLFAYFNPLLVGSIQDSGLLLLSYYVLISSGALYLAGKQKSILLLLMSFCLGSFFIFSLPSNSMLVGAENAYMLKYISIIFIVLSSLYSAIKLKNVERGFIEFLFAGAFFIVGLFGILGSPGELGQTNYMLNMIVALGFMGLSYIHIAKWNSLFSLGTIGGALILAANISWTEIEYLLLNIGAISIFALMNIYTAIKLMNTGIQEKNCIQNLVVATLSAIIFITFSIYSYATHQDQSIIFIGGLYLLLSLVYFGVSYYCVQKFGVEKIKNDTSIQNATYNFLAISISLLSVSIALIFSDYSFVVSLFWLFESAILLYFYKRIKNLKIAFAGVFLMSLGLLEFVDSYKDLVWNLKGQFQYLLPVLFTSVILGLNSINLKKAQYSIANDSPDVQYSINTDLKKAQHLVVKNFHDIIHIIGVIILLSCVAGIFSNFENFVLMIMGFISIGLSIFYKTHGSTIQKVGFACIFSLMIFGHISEFATFFSYDPISIETTILQYMVSSIFCVGAYLFYKGENTSGIQKFVGVATLVYLFVITTLYVHHLFPNTFAITIYWGILAFALVSHGIGKDRIAFRTLGLYLVMLVCAKILFVDISIGINDSIVRVIAFILVGIMFIVIGTMYTRKYGNQLKGEFQLSNLLGQSDSLKHADETNGQNEISESLTKNITVNEMIEQVDITGIQSVHFKPNGGKSFMTKSKNLMKISKQIMQDKTKAEFAPGELQEQYDFIVQNFKSTLNKTELGRVQNAVKDFVEKGGTVIMK